MLRPGDLFDPSVALLGDAHTGTVRTRTPALLCELSRDVFSTLFKSNQDTISRIGRNLAAQKNLGPLGVTASSIESGGLADDILRQMRHYFADSAESRL